MKKVKENNKALIAEYKLFKKEQLIPLFAKRSALEFKKTNIIAILNNHPAKKFICGLDHGETALHDLIHSFEHEIPTIKLDKVKAPVAKKDKVKLEKEKLSKLTSDMILKLMDEDKICYNKCIDDMGKITSSISVYEEKLQYCDLVAQLCGIILGGGNL
jgi:hypothetical protein